MTAPDDMASWPPVPAYARTSRTGGTSSAMRPPPAKAKDKGEGEGGDGDGAAGRVLEGALRWIEAHLEWFAPERWEEFLPPRPFRPGPLLELLGLIRVLDRSGILPKDAPLATRALDLAEHAVSAPGFEHGLRRGDELFPYHLNLIALLDLLGRPHPALRRACSALLAADAGAHGRPYKPALTRIELRYFIDRGGFTAPAALPDLETLHRETIAARGPDVLQLTDSETYALTHVLFYVTDFGHRPPGPGLGGSEEASRLRETVRILLGVHLARGSLDLLAELLLCDAALADGHASAPAVHQGWHMLARAARPDGAVPSPVHRPEILTGLAGDKAAAYLFGTCYHTTMAAALAGAVRKGCASAPSAAEDCFPLPCADPQEIRSWARTVSETSATTPAAARSAWSAQLDPLLALGVQAHDPAVVTELIRAAEHLGQGDRPLIRSAAALLRAWAT
ncbi:DUF6895 family protein [Streptomyces sp. NPDC001514]